MSQWSKSQIAIDTRQISVEMQQFICNKGVMIGANLGCDTTFAAFSTIGNNKHNFWLNFSDYLRIKLVSNDKNVLDDQEGQAALSRTRHFNIRAPLVVQTSTETLS